MESNSLILGQDKYYSLNSYETGLNNNVLVVGASGAGKTRGIVIPNLLQASGSYVVTDPKGNLYGKYAQYLRKKGYIVKKLDFTNPKDSIHYNFFEYIHDVQDIVKIAHMLICQGNQGKYRYDPFWDEASQLLVQACIAYLKETKRPDDHNFHNVMRMVGMLNIKKELEFNDAPLDLLFGELEEYDPDSYAVSAYNKVRIAPDKTLRSILVTLFAKLGMYDTPALNRMMRYDDVDIPSIGMEKTALFVVVSDTDRSLDGLVNIFFTQVMNELCRFADRECKNQCLPVPVRFIMDDFATNCRIEDFPRMISSIRSRNISAMLMIQAESQLMAAYDDDGQTIIGNCDTYVYLGGNDTNTAWEVARRSDIPLTKILTMPQKSTLIFRRGEKPVRSSVFDVQPLLDGLGLE